MISSSVKPTDNKAAILAIGNPVALLAKAGSAKVHFYNNYLAVIWLSQIE